MKSFILTLFVVGFMTTTNDGVRAASDTGGVNIAGVMRSLVETLNTALAKGDMETVRDTLQAVANTIKEMLPKLAGEKSREFFAKLITRIGELIGRITSRKANLQEVRTFTNDLKEKFKQRMIERLKEKST